MDFSLHPLSMVAVVATVLTACYLLYRAALPHPILGIPYHKASARSLLGDMPAMVKHTKQTSQVYDWMVDQCVTLNSPVIQLFVRPLGRPFVVVADFREYQDILMRRSKEFDRSSFFGELFLGLLPHHHISMPSNEVQKKQRRLLADTMSPQFLQDIAAPQIYGTVLDLLELWRLKSALAQGHPWSAPRDIFHAALDAIWASAFEVHTGATKSQLELISATNMVHQPQSRDVPVNFPDAPMSPAFDAVITLTDSLETTIKSPVPVLHHWLLRQLPYMRSAKAYKDKYIGESLERARKKFEASETDEPVNSAVDHMLRRELTAAKKQGRAPEYDTPAIRDELFGFLVGGHETTSTTLCWALKFLTDHQQVQQTLRQALRTNFSSSSSESATDNPDTTTATTNPAPPPPSATDIAKSHIPYLDATIEEILRCANITPGQTRDALCDTEILGHHIPKGTTIFCLSNGPSFKSAPFTVDEKLRSESSRDAKDRTCAWDVTDIGLFMPERWLTRDDEDGHTIFDPRAGPNIPFGLGPRGCFGRKLAEMELRILIVLLVWTFEFQPTPAELSGYAAIDKVTHQPQQCFVRLALAKK